MRWFAYHTLARLRDAHWHWLTALRNSRLSDLIHNDKDGFFVKLTCDNQGQVSERLINLQSGLNVE